MATVPSPVHSNGYPTSDGKPMAETDWHRNLMVDLIGTLTAHFQAQPRVYVSGNLLIFFEQGNRRRHVAPDVFVVRGVPKVPRPNYLLWEEGRAPQVVIEVTSRQTRRTDTGRKFRLYRDVLKVREYFLFDPDGDYLDPPLKGYRLRQGAFRPIRPTPQGRLVSRVLGLHLEGGPGRLRLCDAAGAWLLSPREQLARAEAALQRLERQVREADAKLGEARRKEAGPLQ
jgi:Uma2 family endonuclease